MRAQERRKGTNKGGRGKDKTTDKRQNYEEGKTKGMGRMKREGEE